MNCLRTQAVKQSAIRLSLIAMLAASLATVVPLAAQGRDAMKEEANKKLVVDFYQQFFGDKDITAGERYLAPDYIQHNPNFPDGRDALMNGVKGFFANAPKTKVDIQRVAADGDLVWLHIRQPPRPGGGAGNSVVDIFRVKDGKIVEHWDTIQAIPEKANNPHPMF
jgi:predicted SnoaL-like aldol condensation-catalyzing enzyme